MRYPDRDCGKCGRTFLSSVSAAAAAWLREGSPDRHHLHFGHFRDLLPALVAGLGRQAITPSERQAEAISQAQLRLGGDAAQPARQHRQPPSAGTTVVGRFCTEVELDPDTFEVMLIAPESRGGESGGL